MVTAVEGIYEDGAVRLLEPLSGARRAKVVVVFVEELPAATPREAAIEAVLADMRSAPVSGGWGYASRDELCDEAIASRGKPEPRS